MADEIQFGEVEQNGPERALRPDEDRHYAVVVVGEPQPSDLPIFIDFEAHAEMEQHAAENLSVELGGVLLGRACTDAKGRPFLVVSDCIRAEHYESTRGSFKFTHETWAAITRERQRAAPDLQMVGWYHTHPGWGVFLSGMDLFICDNFFSKPLDIAYVIDPCRHERGTFQWTDSTRTESNRSVQPTGGYYLIASRFRSAELAAYRTELIRPMPTTSSVLAPALRTTADVARAPVADPTQMLTIAILGMLVAQLLLIAVLALKVLLPGRSPGGDERELAAAADKINAALANLEQRRRFELTEERLKTRGEFLDQAFQELKSSDANSISRLQSRFDQSQRLADDVAARDAQLREIQLQLNEARDKILDLKTSAKREEERLATLNQLNQSLREENAKLLSVPRENDPASTLSDNQSPTAKATAWTNDSGRWWWVVGSGVLLAALLWVARAVTTRTDRSSKFPTHPAAV